MKPDDSGSDKPVRPSAIQRAVTLGLELALGMGGLTCLGYWLDRRSGDGFGWTLGGAFLGLLYMAYSLWRTIRGIETEMEQRLAGRDPKEGGEGP
jgi:hypothetical protein